MVRVFIALGSNIEPREWYLQQAVKQMQEKICIGKISSLYQTRPVGYQKQGPFLNAVLAGRTSLGPMALLHFLQGIEERLKRERNVRWGPRTIDLDILLYGAGECQREELIIPHPRIGERPFVLLPFLEICQEPILSGQTAQALLSNLVVKEGDVVWWGHLFPRKGDDDAYRYTGTDFPEL